MHNDFQEWEPEFVKGMFEAFSICLHSQACNFIYIIIGVYYNSSELVIYSSNRIWNY